MTYPDKSFEERIRRIEAKRGGRRRWLPRRARPARLRLLVAGFVAVLALLAGGFGLVRPEVVRNGLRSLGTWSAALLPEERLFSASFSIDAFPESLQRST